MQKPNRHFKLFTGPDTWSGRYLALRSFQEHVRRLGTYLRLGAASRRRAQHLRADAANMRLDYKFTLPWGHYAASIEVLNMYTSLLMLPQDFDDELFLQQYRERAHWLQTGEPTLPVSTQETPQALHTTVTATVLQHPSKPLLLYPNFVYIPGIASGAAQQGPRGLGKSGALADLHDNAPPAGSDIRVLKSLQISTDELCAVRLTGGSYHNILTIIVLSPTLQLARILSAFARRGISLSFERSAHRKPSLESLETTYGSTAN